MADDGYRTRSVGALHAGAGGVPEAMRDGLKATGQMETDLFTRILEERRANDETAFPGDGRKHALLVPAAYKGAPIYYRVPGPILVHDTAEQIKASYRKLKILFS